ncbi:hypothetical protein [Streptomyces sp. NPDC056361]|uniref:hypothetical protein n=1 Tax=Streptomyces sp. NPDC056361 TaxID=3345795 RepID=UPI0035DD8BE8
MTSAPGLTGSTAHADPTAPSRPAGVPRRALAVLGTLACALVAAFVLVPRTVAATGADGALADRRGLAREFRGAFVAYWSSGDRDPSPNLARIIDYWFRFHVAKAVIAALLLITLVALAVLLRKAFLTAGGFGAGRRPTLASTGVLGTLFAVVSVAVLSLAAVMANVQGAAAPFASLFPVLPTGATADGRLAATLAEVRARLADSSDGGRPTPPAVDVMVGDFARYHVAMAVIAAVVAVVLLGASVTAWRRLRSTVASDRPTRLLRVSFVVLSASSSLAAVVVAAANTTTAADPGPALLAFFDGGW